MELRHPTLGHPRRHQLKLWLASVSRSKKDFSADDYFRWRKYYQYCAGLLGDLFPHKAPPLYARHR